LPGYVVGAQRHLEPSTYSQVAPSCVSRQDVRRHPAVVPSDPHLTQPVSNYTTLSCEAYVSVPSHRGHRLLWNEWIRLGGMPAHLIKSVVLVMQSLVIVSCWRCDLDDSCEVRRHSVPQRTALVRARLVIYGLEVSQGVFLMTLCRACSARFQRNVQVGDQVCRPSPSSV
jgi:hypothetical protein